MSLFETLSRSRGDDAIDWIRFRVPGHRLNVLTPQAVADLAAVLDEIDREASAGRPPKAVVLTADAGCGFFAGADLSRLAAVLAAAETDRQAVLDATTAGRNVFNRLGQRPWASIALIDGVCVGGGLELALACDLRLAVRVPQTSFGAPEVKLGLIPGWGGTVRLPRLIGPGPTVEFAAAGESISAEKAAELGLVDACVSRDRGTEAISHLLKVADRDNLVTRRRSMMSAPVSLDPAELAFLEATASAVILGRTGGHLPAPIKLLETVLTGSGMTAAQAESLESEAFADLACGPQPQALLHVFQLAERNKRDDGLQAASSATEAEPPAAVAHAGVVGAGIMGAGIAARHLRSQIPVTVVDASSEALTRQLPVMLEEASWNRELRQSDPRAAVALTGLLRSSTSLAALASAQLVIESVVERLDAKRAVLCELERVVASDAILATNTSTNPIARLAEPLQDPTRFCGFHFFNPVKRMKLVEIVRGPQSSDRAIMTAVAHGKRLGKIPIVVRDSPGFLVNRVLMPYLHESIELLREGVSMRRIDAAARRFGMPLGPIELYDMIGLDTAFYAGLVLHEAYGDRLEAAPVLPAMVKAGRLGCKSGGGFYRYAANGRVLEPDPASEKQVATYAAEPLGGEPARDLDAIADRLVIPMVLEACRALDEDLVRDPSDIDLGVIFGLGFPAFRGGLLAWADSLGPNEILRRLEPLAPLGPRMQPTERLLKLARDGGRFHARQPAVAVSP
jgi:3-hydroxyacyl-CoA dehydrogenase/1,4-dihydroxy-2-naphthoyl-CoA synthase